MIVKLLIYDTEKSIRTNEFATEVQAGLASNEEISDAKILL